MRRLAFLMVAALALSMTGFVVPALATPTGPALTVNGEVTTPTTYSLSQLGAVTQTSVSVTQTARSGTVTATYTGVSVETLVNAAHPAFPALTNTKNELLRVTVTIRGAFGQTVTMALGELDPNFGNHPALLALSVNGHPNFAAPELIVPGDQPPLRTVLDVNRLTVGIATAPATTTTVTGGIDVIDGTHQVMLSAAELAALPQETRSVTFAGPGGSQTHIERGPSLTTVLFASGIIPDVNTWATGVGDDNYAATVTPAEEWIGGRPLLVALTEDGGTADTPRLVPDGDVKGGRYVSGMVDLYVGRGPAS